MFSSSMLQGPVHHWPLVTDGADTGTGLGSATGARAVIRSHNRADLPHTIGSAITSKRGAP